MVDVTSAMESDFVNADLIRESPTKKCVILSAGNFEESEYEGRKYQKFSLDVEIDGKKKIWSPSKDSVKNIASVYGRESSFWVGKLIGLQIVKMRGKDAVMGVPIPMPPSQ